MKLKSKPQDFRVQELLAEGYLEKRGRWRVYRVTKKKITSFEAARMLAELARVEPADVGMAGLKDRQGITTQYMSVIGGRPVRWTSSELKIEQVGFASGPMTSGCSEGNAFEVTLRNLTDDLMARVGPALEEVKQHGFVNYFGEQRFGNLRFGQGWIARDLARGDLESALKNLLCGRSAQDDERHKAFKELLAARWGNWRACRDIAGKFGAHHSVFEVLAKDPEDLLGALRRVAARLRLIHLYAWQSHVWNRAVEQYVHSVTPRAERLYVDTIEGRITFARGALNADPAFRNLFRLPGAGLEDVAHARQRELFVEVLREEGLRPDEFRIDGVGGFQLKGEERALVVYPRLLRSFTDARDPGRVTLAFELPRGAYATLLVARLLGQSPEPYAPRGFEGSGGGGGESGDRRRGAPDRRGGPQRGRGRPDDDEDDDFDEFADEEPERPVERAPHGGRGPRGERGPHRDRAARADGARGPAPSARPAPADAEPSNEGERGAPRTRAPRSAPFLPPGVAGSASRARGGSGGAKSKAKKTNKDKGKPVGRRKPGRANPKRDE
ncbi:MAG: tRNA pseudouridine(13) synthase TruD [Planctomycetes bacterium]|nr:tRNA pseudouridine(13) synthase TruD [Planctomycetota bacterium]